LIKVSAETLSAYRCQKKVLFTVSCMSTSINHDTETVRKAQRGDPQAFAVLLFPWRDKAFSMCLRMLQDRHDAEDVFQDACVRAFTGLHTFRGDAAFGTWFYRIVYTTCLNALKRRGRLPPHEELVDEPAVEVDDVISQLDTSVAVDVVREEMAKMPPLYAVVMDLFYIQECSHDDISRITAMPIGTIKTRLNRGRKALRDALLLRLPELEGRYT